MSDLDTLYQQAVSSKPNGAAVQTATSASTGTDALWQEAQTATKPAQQPLPPSATGDLADQYYSTSAVGRVLNAFGQGVKDAWGTRPLGLDDQTEQSLAKLNWINDYKNGKTSILKSFNEAFIRPAAALADLVARGPSAVISGLEEGAYKATGDETIPSLIEYATSRGDIGTDFHPTVIQGKAESVIGTAESPASETIRNQAIGQLNPLRTANPPSIHDVARSVAPDVFSQYDSLAANHEFLINQFEQSISKGLESGEQPIETHQLREIIKDNYAAMQELAPDVKQAYQIANELLRNPEVADIAPQKLDTTPTQPTDAISKSVSTELQGAGRPAEEADAVGSLVQAQYQIRAARFEGKLGTAEELYNKESPDIVPGENNSSKGYTLNQDDNIIPFNQKEVQKSPLTEKEYFDKLDEWLYSKEVQPEKPESSNENTKQGNVTILAPIAELNEGLYGEQAALRYNRLHQELHNKYGDGIANKATKQELGILHDLDQRSIQSKPFGKKELPSIELGDEGQNPYYQGNKIAPRGSLTLVDNGRNILKIFKAADASTAVHEFGHQWTMDLLKDAEHPEAPDDLKADAQTVRNYVGNKGEDLNRAQHEKMAKSFEKYLMEGRAPSVGLMKVFAQFKAWLIKVYSTVNNLKVPINDDIRGVFDRWLNKPEEKGVVTPEEETSSESPQEASGQAPTQGGTPLPETQGQPSTGSTEALQPSYSLVGGELVQDTKPKVETASEPVNPDRLQAQPKETPKGPNDTFFQGPSKYINKAGNINLDKFETTDDVENFIKDFNDLNADSIKERRGNVTYTETQNLAEAAGLSTDNIQKNIKALERMSFKTNMPLSARVDGLRTAFIQSAQNLVEAAKEDDATFANAVLIHQHIQSALSGITAEVGRTLNIMKIKKGQFEFAEQLDEYLQSNIGKSLKDIQTLKQTVAGLDTPAKVAGMLEDFKKPSYGEMLLEMYRNWLISGPITHMIYHEANQLFALYKAVPETLARAAVGALRGTPERAYAGEAWIGLKTFLFSQREGLKTAWESAKLGQTLALPGEEAATTPFTTTKAIPGMLGTAVRFPGERMVAPIHSMNRTIGYLVNRDQLIYRQAYGKEGLRGDVLNQRVAELQHNVPDDIMTQARDAATEQTLMGKTGALTKRISGVVNWQTELPLLGRTKPISFLEPFINVVSNINRQAFLERSPMAIASSEMRNTLSGENGIAKDTAIAKIGLGTAFAASIAGMCMTGEISGPPAQDWKEEAVRKMTEGAPYSVKVGHMAYRLDRLGVIGVQIALAADMYHFADQAVNDSFSKAASGLVYSVGNHFTQEGFASGISDLFKAVDDPDHYGPNYVNNFLTSAIIPYSVGMAQVAHWADPYQRQAHGFMQELVSKIPGASFTLQNRVDIFGQPVPNKEYWGVYADQINNDPVVKEMEKSGYFPAPVSKKILGVTLTDEQYHDYAMKAGLLAKMQLNQIIGMSGFDNLPTTTKHTIMEEAVKSSRESAESYLMIQNPDILKQAIAIKTGQVQ